MLRKTMVLGFSIAALAGCSMDTGADKGAADPEGADISTQSLGAADGASGARAAAWCEVDEGALSRRRPYESWTFDGACEDVFVDLASRDGDDTFLLIYSRPAGAARWELIDWNDDCYSGTLNSCVALETEAGFEYRAVATTYAYIAWNRPTPASYDLRISCRDAAGECVAPGADATGQACGSRGLAECPDGFYCDWEGPVACGMADGPGTCQPRPDACIALYDPVCGCDGNTYGNACSAASAGVDVSAEGECERPGQGEGETCGGIAALQCADGLTCDYSANDGCYADAGGTCVYAEPRACTREYNPVCGCDGVTYSNDCVRRAAYVGFDHPGAC